MRSESLPDIPHQDQPERDRLKNAAEKAVVEKVAELDIGLDLVKHPELRSRLAEIGSHFQDSVDMAKIIRTVYRELSERLELNEEGPARMMRAAVLHDIGKSGPPGEKGEFHLAVRKLFATPDRPFNPFIHGRAKTINDFLTEQDVADREKIMETLEKAGISPEKEPMIHFWRRHAEWTYGILKSDPGSDVDADLVNVAATHHLMEDQNPAKLEISDVPKEAHVLEVLEQAQLLAAVDKYQAFRARGGMKHEGALAQLTKNIDSRPDLPASLRDKFKIVVEILDRSKDELEKYFKK